LKRLGYLGLTQEERKLVSPVSPKELNPKKSRYMREADKDPIREDLPALRIQVMNYLSEFDKK